MLEDISSSSTIKRKDEGISIPALLFGHSHHVSYLLLTLNEGYIIRGLLNGEGVRSDIEIECDLVKEHTLFFWVVDAGAGFS